MVDDTDNEKELEMRGNRPCIHLCVSGTQLLRYNSFSSSIPGQEALNRLNHLLEGYRVFFYSDAQTDKPIAQPLAHSGGVIIRESTHTHQLHTAYKF